MSEPLTYTMTLRLTADMAEELQELADADDRPLASYIRLALLAHILDKRPVRSA